MKSRCTVALQAWKEFLCLDGGSCGCETRTMGRLIYDMRDEVPCMAHRRLRDMLAAIDDVPEARALKYAPPKCRRCGSDDAGDCICYAR